MKKWLFIGVLIAVAAGSYSKWGHLLKMSAQNSGLAQRPTTAVVEPRNIDFAVNAAGDIGPAEQVSVRPEVNGRIESLAVDIGDQVKAGDPLFTLDDRDLQIERESQQKEIDRTRIQLDQAERNYSRAKLLFDSNLISREVYEDTRTQFELSKVALSRAEKNLELVTDRLRKTRILAPFDCTVLTRPVSVGQAVSGSGGFNSGTEVMTIANLNEMVINAHINQADITRLQAGKEVEVMVEAVPGLKVSGKVERVAPQSTIRNNIKGYAVRILLKDVDKRVRPGMTANLKIPVASRENVLAVPLSAVFTERNPENQQMERFVYVKKGDRFDRLPVTVGIADFFFVEIIEGLTDGDVVALEIPKEGVDKASQAKAGATNAPAGAGTPATRPVSGGARPAGGRQTSVSTTTLAR
jgi:HlyD family secretion protein